jgi:hypothetical protein
MGKTVTNGNIDTACAAVPAPYGPLVRVTSVTGGPTPNSEIALELTSALGVTVHMTFEQLEDADIRLSLLKAAHGHIANARALSAAIDAIDVVNETVKSGGNFTVADYTSIMNAINTNLGPWIGGRY